MNRTLSRSVYRIAAFAPPGHIYFFVTSPCVVLETRNVTEMRINGDTAQAGVILKAGDILEAIGDGELPGEVLVRTADR